MVVEEQSFLHYIKSEGSHLRRSENTVHLLKLVTGVEISTRAVNKSGRPGNPVKSSNRTAAAAPNKVAFLLSIFILGSRVSTGRLHYFKQ